MSLNSTPVTPNHIVLDLFNTCKNPMFDLYSTEDKNLKNNFPFMILTHL